MKSRTWLFAAALSISGLALAQAPMKPGVTESTDPAKIAEIEAHAQRLSGGAGAAPAPMMGEHEHMRKHGMRHHKRMHKGMRKHEMKEKAPSDTPMATEPKS